MNNDVLKEFRIHQDGRFRLSQITMKLFIITFIIALVMLNYVTVKAFRNSAKIMSNSKLFKLKSSSTLITTNKTKPLKNPKELLDKTDVFIFDCDGVIWKGDSLIDKVSKVLDKLRQDGKTIFFVTNNSTKSRKGYLKKFTGLGLTVKPEGIHFILQLFSIL